VPRHESPLPKHRGPSSHPPVRSGLRRCVTLGGLAVTATGLAVASGVVGGARHAAPDSAAAVASTPLAPRVVPASAADEPGTLADRTVVRRVTVDLRSRAAAVSRSEQRTAVPATTEVDATKKKALDQGSGGQVTRTEDLTHRDPRAIARAMLSSFGFGPDQFSCLDSIYSQESGWNVHADNPSSSAYGIPQALPGSKMSSAGSHWADDATTQIRWGLGYIKGRYGTPCGAWRFKQSHGWY
jgi:hypothetical protein